MKTLGMIFLIGFVSLPLAFVITFLMSSFWGWFEAKTGIESLGHSGPADWCFGVTYLFVVIAGLGGWLLLRKKPPTESK